MGKTENNYYWWGSWLKVIMKFVQTLNVYETKLESIKGSYCQPWAVSSIQHVSYSVELRSYFAVKFSNLSPDNNIWCWSRMHYGIFSCCFLSEKQWLAYQSLPCKIPPCTGSFLFLSETHAFNFFKKSICLPDKLFSKEERDPEDAVAKYTIKPRQAFILKYISLKPYDHHYCSGTLELPSPADA